MNSTDADTDLPDGDLLVGIFDAQRDLIERYHGIEESRGFRPIPEQNYGVIDDRFVQARIRLLMWFITEELGEAANCLKNKPWKQTEVPTNEDHFYEELVDALHFFVELCIVAGISPIGIAERYHKKRSVNRMRQDTGY